jgi:formylglycine-generating enzyme required for sulfatase activity
MRRPLLLALVALWAFAGCRGKQRTALVVEVDSNLAVPSELDKVDVAVTANGKTEHMPYSLIGGYSLPLRTALVETTANSGTVDLVATGLLNGASQVSQEAIVGFVEGQAMLLKLFLAAECRGAPCSDPTKTCTTGGVCVGKVRTPSDLIPFDPNKPEQSVDLAVITRKDASAPDAAGAADVASGDSVSSQSPDMAALRRDAGVPDGGGAATVDAAGRVESGLDISPSFVDAGTPDAPAGGEVDSLLDSGWIGTGGANGFGGMTATGGMSASGGQSGATSVGGSGGNRDAGVADASDGQPDVPIGGSGGNRDAGVADASDGQPDVPIGGSGGNRGTGGSSGAGGTTSAGSMGIGGAATGGTSTGGGTNSSGGTTSTGGNGGAVGTGGFTGTPIGTPSPSCAGLAATCGPSGNESCCTSLLVPGGTFYRSYDGVDFTDKSYPATVDDFYLDKYEITVGRFRQFVNAGMGTQRNPPAPGAGVHPLIAGSGWDSAWNGNLPADTASLKAAVECTSGGTGFYTWTDTPAGNESRPQNCINWYDAFAFCAWDGGRIPTEAEWNYAAAGGNEQRVYPWGSGLDPSKASYYDPSLACTGNGIPDCTLTDLIVVGTKPGGNGRWGHADLAGNVWEWALDFWWNNYYPMPCSNCAYLATASARVDRGGSFNWDASSLQSANRTGWLAWARMIDHGARCARAVKPSNLSIKRESDTTRQVRLSWEYPSAVDIYIHNGDANGYYVESFSGATVVSGVTDGTWLDADAPSYSARYYRVRAVDTGQWAIDTAMKWDLQVPCGYPTAAYSLPAGSGTPDEVFGDQLPCGYFLPQAGGGLVEYSHMCSATPPVWDGGGTIDNSFFLEANAANCPRTVTTVGLLRSASSITVNPILFFGTHFPMPVSLSQIDWSSAHGGSGPTNSDTLDLWYTPQTDTSLPDWTGCWRSTDGHWYRETDNALCDSAQLLPGQGYWYTALNTDVTFTIPKPYSNP